VLGPGGEEVHMCRGY